ncbi:MAG TPA: aconitase family protein, partial [Bryobacteraceae bacterium]|nr:aconitase family protein [Bryobacteraceae bacterium]
METKNSFGAAATLKIRDQQYRIFRLEALDKAGLANTSKIPYSIRILLENLLRFEDDRIVKAADIEYVARWEAIKKAREISFRPARVLLQDFTGVPAVVDIAAMRDALRAMGADPKFANPLIPVDLVIDHSVQVDEYGTPGAFAANALLEFHRNQERYALLKWAQTAFGNFRAVPPDTG